MADIKPAEISAIIKKQLTGSDLGPSLSEVGTVLQVGDGIARVYGLSNVQYGELVKFENKNKWEEELTGINSVIPWIKDNKNISIIIS